LALSQSQDALDHPAHGRLRSKRRASPGLRLATPRQIHRALAQVKDLCDVDLRGGQHHHRPASTTKQHPSHWKKRALSRAQHPRQRKPSPPRRVQSPEDQIQPFNAITTSEATKGSGAPNKILTYGYVKPRVQWLLNEEEPPNRPLKDRLGPRGLYPSGMLAHTLWRRSSAEPDSTMTSAWGTRACPSPV
jgi:hypothetical protein